MRTEAVATCRDVVRVYRTGTEEVQALRGVDAVFQSAHITALVGPSGSGKSTLLRLLAGLDTPSSGTVEVGGRDLAGLSGRELRGLRRSFVGYIFQRPSDNFVPYMSVREHLALAHRLADNPADGEELVARLGIAHCLDRQPWQLSGGEQQRAAFAQVLAAGPRLMVADEPTAELDTASAGQLLELIASVAADGVAFVIATHDVNAAAIADDAIQIHHGALVIESAPSTPAEVEPPRRRSSYARASAKGVPAPVRAAPTVLDVVGVNKAYRRGPELVHALENVNARFCRGEITGLVGRSGSGKTTLLNILAGWESADSGRVAWGDGSDLAVSMIPWQDIAVLPQRVGLIDELTVRENVSYPARLLGRGTEMVGRVEDLLESLGLDLLADRYPAETSVGEQQRTGLARALLLGPRVLLADEPSGHQNAEFERAVFGALRDVASRGTCCIVATHNPDVGALADHVLLMADGRLSPPSDM